MKGQIIHKTAIDGERCRKKEKETDKQQTEKNWQTDKRRASDGREREKRDHILTYDLGWGVF